MVSIIVPVYRTSEYIFDCINSILQQTYIFFELLLIDDGSDDDCAKKLDYLSLQDNRIKVIHKNNEGVSTARNMGLCIAVGEYITFIDSDDTIEKNYLEELVLAMQSNSSNSLVVCTCNDSFDMKIIKNKSYCKKDYMQLCYDSIAQAACGKLYKASIICENNIRVNPDISIAEDFLFNTQYVDFSGNGLIVVLDKHLYNYRIRDGSLSNTYRSDYLDGNLITLSFLKSCLKKWKVEKDEWQLYYNLLYRMYEFAFVNILCCDDNLSIKERICKINDILSSEKFKFVLKNTNFHINIVYRISYYLQRYEIFYCFEKIRKLFKNKGTK